MIGIDPDVIIGYNILNFDLPYLLDRAKAIKVHGFPMLVSGHDRHQHQHHHQHFVLLLPPLFCCTDDKCVPRYQGRIKGCSTKMSDATFSSRAYGTRESKEVKIDGRVNFDLLQAIQRDYKLASYSLNAVSVSGFTYIFDLVID